MGENAGKSVPVLTDQDLGELGEHHRELLAIVALISLESGYPVSEIIADALEESPLVKAYRLGSNLAADKHKNPATCELNERLRTPRGGPF
jgi:hypothetical protein